MKKLILPVACALMFLGCSEGDNDKISEAQACLDRATQYTVGECENMVAGIAGPGAGLIRCSANFISQGFTGSRFASAFRVLQEQESGVNSTVAMISYLVFTVGGSDSARRQAASTAVTNCTSSGLKGMIMFANFAAVATELSMGLSIDPSNPPDPADMQANISNCASASSPCDDTTIANTAIAISTIYCGNNSSSKDADFCATINDAADEGSAAAIVAKLKTLLNQTP